MYDIEDLQETISKTRHSLHKLLSQAARNAAAASAGDTSDPFADLDENQTGELPARSPDPQDAPRAQGVNTDAITPAHATANAHAAADARVTADAASSVARAGGVLSPDNDASDEIRPDRSAMVASFFGGSREQSTRKQKTKRSGSPSLHSRPTSPNMDGASGSERSQSPSRSPSPIITAGSAQIGTEESFPVGKSTVAGTW